MVFWRWFDIITYFEYRLLDSIYFQSILRRAIGKTTTTTTTQQMSSIWSINKVTGITAHKVRPQRLRKRIVEFKHRSKWQTVLYFFTAFFLHNWHIHSIDKYKIKKPNRTIENNIKYKKNGVIWDCDCCECNFVRTKIDSLCTHTHTHINL